MLFQDAAYIANVESNIWRYTEGSWLVFISIKNKPIWVVALNHELATAYAS
jgi:hypothetical protein